MDFSVIVHGLIYFVAYLLQLLNIEITNEYGYQDSRKAEISLVDNRNGAIRSQGHNKVLFAKITS